MTAEACVVVPDELPVERLADWRHGAGESEHGASSGVPARFAIPCRYRLPLPGEMKCR